MGTWGTDIFSDDLAADLRSQWRAHVADGLPGVEATRHVLAEHAEVLNDPDVAAVFWIALALTQHRAGRIEPMARAAALRYLGDPRELDRWKDDPKQHRRRRAVLEKARLELLSIAPAPKRIAKVFRAACDWAAGDLIAYQLLSGIWTVFRVVWLHTDLGGTSPVGELLDWSSPSPPDAAPTDLQVRTDIHVDWLPENRFQRLMIGALNARHRPGHRLKLLEQSPASKYVARFAPSLVVLWPDLDEALERHFGLT